MSPESLAAACLAIPVAGAALIALAARRPNVREGITLVTATLLALAALSLAGAVAGGARPSVQLLTVVPGLDIRLAVDPLGALFAAIAAPLWVVNSVYSLGYMRANDEPRQTPFYVCFALALAGTMGVALAGNLFTLFLFYEALTLSTWPLVTHRRDAAAAAAGRLYLGLLVGLSIVLFLPAIAATAALTGTLDFRPGGILAGRAAPWQLALLLALFVFGIGKAAVMPVHRWLPAAMVAPTPVSALLHAVAVVKAGVFSILKIVLSVFGIDTLASTGAAGWLTVVAGFTVVAASAIALGEDHIKRRLAYSTIAQLSYVVLAAAVLAPVSAAGAALHIAAHAFGKITLFFAAGALHTVAHLDRVSELSGIGRRMPWTMGAFAVGAISLIGLPPAAGFLGKWLIFEGAMATGNWVAVGVVVLSTGLGAAYLLPILTTAFLKSPPAPARALGAAAASEPKGEAPLPMLLAMAASATATVLLFLFPDGALRLAELAVAR